MWSGSWGQRFQRTSDMGFPGNLVKVDGGYQMLSVVLALKLLYSRIALGSFTANLTWTLSNPVSLGKEMSPTFLGFSCPPKRGKDGQD